MMKKRQERAASLRAGVEQVLLDIDTRERTGMPVARVRFVQIVREVAQKKHMHRWASTTQGEQEAGEEALNRLLDGKWYTGRNGIPKFSNTNVGWVLNLWEVGIGEWERRREEPFQMLLETSGPSPREMRESRLDDLVERTLVGGWSTLGGCWTVWWDGSSDGIEYSDEELDLVLTAVEAATSSLEVQA